VVPTILWIQIFFCITLPVRMILCVELVTDTLQIKTPNIDRFMACFRRCTRINGRKS
jgi:hypothetical protein